MIQMMMKSRCRLKIMSGPGDTRGRGVLGHDRGSPPYTLLLVVLVVLLVLLALLILVNLYLCTSDSGITDTGTQVQLLILMLEHDRGLPTL